MVVLSNESSENGVICADAVRFGGGMGNISRGTVSGLPRYLEGARYSAQWAGMPYDVYGGKQGQMTMLTTSMHAPTPSITCPVVLYSIPDKKDWVSPLK